MVLKAIIHLDPIRDSDEDFSVCMDGCWGDWYTENVSRMEQAVGGENLGDKIPLIRNIIYILGFKRANRKRRRPNRTQSLIVWNEILQAAIKYPNGRLGWA